MMYLLTMGLSMPVFKILPTVLYILASHLLIQPELLLTCQVSGQQTPGNIVVRSFCWQISRQSRSLFEFAKPDKEVEACVRARS